MAKKSGTSHEAATPGIPVGNRAIVVAGIVAGFFVVSFAASYSPQLVNGVLLLVLVGTVLGNADRWLPYLAQFSNTASDVRNFTAAPTK